MSSDFRTLLMFFFVSGNTMANCQTLKNNNSVMRFIKMIKLMTISDDTNKKCVKQIILDQNNIIWDKQMLS